MSAQTTVKTVKSEGISTSVINTGTNDVMTARDNSIFTVNVLPAKSVDVPSYKQSTEVAYTKQEVEKIIELQVQLLKNAPKPAPFEPIQLKNKYKQLNE
jgi:hypothetical protein